LELNDLDGTLIDAFLEDLEKRRRNGPRSRNLRLTAIRSFFRYASLEAPAQSSSAYTPTVSFPRSLLERAGKASQFRLGNTLSEAEAREQPIILVGAFSNLWTLEWSRNLRYYFHRDIDKDGVQVSIRDRKDPRNVWSIPYVARDRMTVDYAIVARVADPVTRNPVIAIAGLTHYGTQAEATFATDQKLWDSALRDAPPGWQSHNFEAVLETSVINRTPNRTKILTLAVW
jgi:hypothetical protein